MDRREFFKKGSIVGLAAGTYLTFGDKINLFANSKTSDPQLYDLVAIKGGEPDLMFDKAIQSFGGMKNFVKKNQTVVIKPNIGWDTSPERAANTNPKLISQIIKHCFDAGAKDVYVFDHTCDNWTSCYSNSGIERAAKDAGAKVVSGGSESYYQKINIPKGKRLKETTVHELILESDVFINVPILKSHGGAGLTISMKNLMGVVWDRGYWHRNDLHQCIADYASFRKPDLNIIDAYSVMKTNGPRGISEADVMSFKSQIISTDMVAADAAAAKLFGKVPSEIDYIRIADEMKIGTMDLSKLKINRIIL
ncbi:MAG: DUF362 domain-containing protein [Bacteroidetes bacterium]|nr:DUF362 domain-containing protein [Bacteroidota bacterium]MBU1115366.1 DUF362 domain-containing protein [Bacteroidota bacterium]MBU1800487.1 DUF362 domain-containing protein [Bacteroidota bacterium]